jgi:DNA-binding NarL/FixJ family response regulator
VAVQRLADDAAGVHGRAAELARIRRFLDDAAASAAALLIEGAAGRTNREAAAELYMGLRTIEAHLSAIYRKLSVRSRSELARTWTARDSAGS